MKKLLTLIAVSILCCIFHFSAVASHAMGGEITYRDLGGNTYEITMSFYRDCMGISASAAYLMSVSSLQAGYNLNCTVFEQGLPVEVSNICPSQVGNSTCGGGSYPGFQKYLYKGTITLPALASDWTLSVSIAARNAAISNIANPGGTDLYMESVINNLNGPNSSPEFSNLPVIVLPIGQTQNLTWTTFDIDGDSLSYKLASALSAHNTPVVYINPFTAEQPISHFLPTILDSLTGIMSVSPSTVQHVVVAMIVTQYRNGQFMGSVRRDLQLVMINAPNLLPTLSGINGTSDHEISIAPDSLLQFTVNSSDPDTSQTLTVTCDSSLVGSSFVTNGLQFPTGTFSWTPPQSLAGQSVILTITVRDDNCAYNGIQGYAYKINILDVNHPPQAGIVYANTLPDSTVDITMYGQPNSWFIYDPDGNVDSSSLHITQAPMNGTAYVNNGEVIYTPNSGFTGTDFIYYAICDSGNPVYCDSSYVIVSVSTLQMNAVITNPTCLGSSTGSICTNVSGGSSPYTYLWSNGTTQVCAPSLPEGTYWVQVNDAAGNFILATNLIVGPGSQIIPVITASAPIIVAGQNDTLNLSVTGGTFPYTYSWSTGDVSSSIIVTQPGIYCAAVSDANGCSGSTCVSISDSVVATASHTNVSCYGYSDGIVAVSVSGGLSPYTYAWSPNVSSSSTAYNLSPGTYSVTVTDMNGDTENLSVTIQQPLFPLSATYTASVDTLSPGVVDTLSAIGNSGWGGYTYSWIPSGNSDSFLVVNQPGTYEVDIMDANGCWISHDFVVTGCSEGCVWPGDANDDGTVDNTDLLSIGLAYGYYGYARDSASLNWYPQYCTDWSDSFSSGINIKHADCDGNSVVDLDDTAAVLLNYGLTHPLKMGSGNLAGGVPELTIEFTSDTLQNGDMALATIQLGDANVPADNVYGIAFTINCDPAVVDSTVASIVHFSDSWLCNPGDHISINKEFHDAGKIDVALTRTDHQYRSGSGVIGTLSLKISTDLISGSGPAYYKFITSLSNILMLDQFGNELPVNSGLDSVLIHNVANGVHELSDDQIKLYPNPVNDYLRIENLPASPIEVQIFDPSGRILVSNETVKTERGELLLNTSDLASGLFFVKLRFENGNVVRRFVKGQ